MSAFIVPHDHIDGLLTFAIQKRYGSGAGYLINGNRIEITRQNATEIGRILLTENERSVYHRYPDTGPRKGNAPGTKGQDAETYNFKPFDRPLSAVSILKACDCFDYQACETDDYEESLAYKIIDGIRQRAISCLPGYDEAEGWSLSRKRRAA